MQTASTHRSIAAILLGGGIAATADILYAFIANGQYGRTPLWVLQSVASGWLGSEAFTSGLLGGTIGLLSHYAILSIAAAIYFAASTRVPVLRSQAVACGALFGVLVYLFMNFVVLPVSAFPFKLSYTPLRLLEGFATHAMFVGIPIALCIQRLSQPGEAPSASDDKGMMAMPDVEGMRQEYTEINSNIRHYSLLRFTVLTVYFAAFGGISSVAFGFFVSQSGNNDFLETGARVAGFLVTILFSHYEYLIIEVLKKNRERGKYLEEKLGYRQITLRSQNAITISQYTARIFYYTLALFWLVMIFSH